jgi:tetratricopeptide (TPR) repeat protein
MRVLLCLLALVSASAADPVGLRLVNDGPFRVALERELAREPAAEAPVQVWLRWRQRLAQGYIGLRRYDLAEAELRAALLLAPTSPVLHSNLSVTLGKQGRYAEALAEADAALALDPDLLHARLVRPSWELGLGQREAAIAHFQAVSRPGQDRDLALYYAAQACFYADAGVPEKVEEGIREALARDPAPYARNFFARDVVFDRYRAEPWFIALVGATLDRAY